MELQEIHDLICTGADVYAVPKSCNLKKCDRPPVTLLTTVNDVKVHLCLTHWREAEEVSDICHARRNIEGALKKIEMKKKKWYRLCG